MSSGRDLFAAARAVRAPAGARARVWSAVTSDLGIASAPGNGSAASSAPLAGRASIAPAGKSAVLVKGALALLVAGALVLGALLASKVRPAALEKAPSGTRVGAEIDRPAQHDPLSAASAIAVPGVSVRSAPPESSARSEHPVTEAAARKRSLHRGAGGIVEGKVAGSGVAESQDQALAREAKLIMEARAALRGGDLDGAQAKLREIQATIPSPQLLPEEFELERRVARLRANQDRS